MGSTERSWSPTSLTVSALLVVIACIALGRWQLGRVDRPVDGYSAEPAAVPLDRLVPLGGSVSAAVMARQVTLTGSYDPAAQVTEPGHLLGGQPVYWVVTMLDLPGQSQVQVVRGWVTQPGQSLAQPPTGPVTVTARLERGTVGAGPSGGRLSSGYLVRTAQSPPDPLSLQPVPALAPKNDAQTQFHLQNAIYVTQWWLLAGIMIAFWWRLMRASRGQTGDLEPLGARR